MNLVEYLARFEELAWLRFELAGNTLLRWLVAIVAILFVLVALRVAMDIVRRRTAAIAERTGAPWADAAHKTLSATKGLFLLIFALYCGLLLVELPERAREISQAAAVVALLVQLAFWGTVLMTFSIERYMKSRMETDAAAATTVSAMSFVGRLVLWSVVLLLALENMGVNVTALVAGLGVGGIAVALAAQNILGDLFASLSIVLDQPFVLGDFIIVGNEMGTVEHIGLKTTRLRSLTGEQLIFSNNDLLQSRIRNFKRMYQRRIVFSVGVTYQTSQEHLAAIPGMIREIVEAHEQTRFDRSHFKEFGAYSLNFETVYYVLVPAYVTYMDIQHAINLAIFEKFAAEGIEFAYPTQTLFMEKATDDGRAE